MKKIPVAFLTCLLPLLVFAQDNKNDDLSGAADKGDLAEVTKLLDAGADINWQDENMQETALMHASVRKHGDVVKFLLQHGAKVNLQNTEGRTALFWSVYGYDHESGILKMLVDAGADPNIADKKRETPLSIGYIYEAADIETLLNAKANPNLLNTRGYTPLMTAAIHDDREDIMLLLLKAGADINMENKDGETALMKAQQCGQVNSIKLLKDHDAKDKPVLISKPDATSDVTNPGHAWALAADAQYAQSNSYSHQMLGYESEGGFKRFWKDSILAYNWEIHSKAELEKKLKWLAETGDREMLRKKTHWKQSGLDALKEPTKFLAFDLVRYISRVRAGYAAGYFTRAEAWEHIMPVAARLQKAFKSWEEMGADRLEGRILMDGNSPGFEMVYKLLINHNDPNSPWTINAWNTSLGKPAEVDPNE